MRYLITGGCGFMGSNLAQEVIKRDAELLIVDNLSRFGSEENLKWIKTLGPVEFKQLDVRSSEEIDKTIHDYQPDVVFHLAGQVAMTTSLENPKLDLAINVEGTLNILEALRKYSPKTIMVYSSTNKVYGDLEALSYKETPFRYQAENHPLGFDEQLPLAFSTPYGCSKGAADQYVMDYSKNFDLRTVVFRHSSAFGLRQFSTFDQGWIGWFVRQAIETKHDASRNPFTVSGSGKQVRDVLFSSDLVRCYFKAVDNISTANGEVFNIGGGYKNSLSPLELFNFLEQKLNVKLNYEHLPWRRSDQKVFIADIRKAEKVLNWSPTMTVEDGLFEMINWAKNNG